MSGKKECPACAWEVDDTDEKCPICGYEFPKQKNWIIWVAALLIIMLLFLLLRY